MEENISSIYGSKFLATLQPLNVEVNIDTDDVSIKNNEGECSRFTADDEEELRSQDLEELSSPQINRPSASLDGQVGIFPNKYDEDELSLDRAVSGQNARTIALATLENPSPAARQLRVQGYVSRAGLGVGRNDNERQFVYLNRRPVDMPKLIKVLNEASGPVSAT